jgi:amidohydrolase
VKKLLPVILCFFSANTIAQKNFNLDEAVNKLQAKTIAWRRDIHQNPELGNREFRTAKLIAAHLRSLGIEVQEGVAKTGVVGILKGGKPGPVIALRADIDALPVTERADVPFASKAKAMYNGQEVGVMHACGHDSHVAMLMTAAEILAGMRKELAGTVKFVFQPSEEGPPAGEEGGAELMVKEGVLDNPKVDVMFGIHIAAGDTLGTISYKEAGIMAESDWFTIKIKGKQSHGAAPWKGVDPVVVGSQIINGLQTVVSRQSDLTQSPVVVSTTMFKGGVRENIIPEEVTLGGTIRTLDKKVRDQTWANIERMAKNIAEASGATAEVIFSAKTGVTYNNIELTKKMAPTLSKVTGGRAYVVPPQTGAEDFSFFAEKVPSLYFFVGAAPKGTDPAKAAGHHTPDFVIDEEGMKTGTKAYVQLVLDYIALSQAAASGKKATPKSF